MLEKLLPAFNATQKIPALDIMDILASKAPKPHRELMTDHGFDSQMATTEELVEICECAETKENVSCSKNSKNVQFKSGNASLNNKRHKQKKQKKKLTTTRAPFFCKLHDSNTSHASINYKVLNARSKQKLDWKRKNLDGVNKYKDYQSKYKKNTQKLHLLHIETKKEKAKWTKAYKKLKSNPKTQQVEDASKGKASGNSKQSCTSRTFTPCEHIEADSLDNRPAPGPAPGAAPCLPQRQIVSRKQVAG
jgi:hypothetical protein